MSSQRELCRRKCWYLWYRLLHKFHQRPHFATRFHALFNGDLYGGNVNFTESIVELVRIKKRTGKDTKFKTIFEKEIQCNEDLSIEYLDYFEPTGEIEYAYVPVISGGEANYIVNKVTSAFDHYFLCEKGRSFPLILDAKYTQEITYESNQVKPLAENILLRLSTAIPVTSPAAWTARFLS